MCLRVTRDNSRLKIGRTLKQKQRKNREVGDEMWAKIAWIKVGKEFAVKQKWARQHAKIKCPVFSSGRSCTFSLVIVFVK